MTDDNKTRKKKRGRKNKIFRSCFPSLITPTQHKPFLCDKNLDAATKNGRVLIPVDNDCIPKHRPRISRLVKAVLFGSLKAKKIHRSSSKSSMASDTSGSYITYDKTADVDNNVCVRECVDTDDTISNSSNLLTSSSSSSRTNCSSNSYSTSSCSSTFSTSRSSSQQKSSSSSCQIDLVDFKNPISSKSFLDQKVSARMDPRHLRHQDSSASVSLPLSKNPKPMNSIHKSLSFQKGISRLDSLDSASLRSLSSLNREKNKYSRNNGHILWCFFLFLSLVVLVVYGRIFSILCTSTWFYFVPCLRIKRVNSSTNMTAFVDTNSEQYKKRIIMAGLLDRTRNPFR